MSKTIVFGDRPPKGYGWFAFVCTFNALFFLACAAIAVSALLFENISLQIGTELVHISALDLLLVSLPLAAIYGIGPLLPHKPWAWYYNLAILFLSATTFYLLPITIVAIVFWLRDPMKYYYRYIPQGPQILHGTGRLPKSV